MPPLTLFSTAQSLLLVTALSVDAFVASFAYGTNRIQIPFLSNVVINMVCSAILTAALLCGGFVHRYIPAQATGWISFAVLMLLGVSKLFDTAMKSLFTRVLNSESGLTFQFKKLKFFITVMTDSTKADVDCSKSLSCREAVPLAVALSIDGLAAGFSVALVGVNVLEMIVFSLAAGVLAVLLGTRCGNKIAEKLDLDLSWVSGVILILLAIFKLK